MTNIIEIAKANGAERIEAYDEFTQSGVFFQDDQLRATVEQVCAPLVKQLIDARATFLALQPDFGGPVAAQMGLAIGRINIALQEHRTLIGDKE